MSYKDYPSDGPRRETPKPPPPQPKREQMELVRPQHESRSQ